MLLSQEIEAPFTLASLPHAISRSDGRPHAASVCSISGIKKRKRTEIAVGIDGEGISIYSLQNPHLATSYALPPQTSFASAPYSVYRKGNSRRQPRRFTYALINENLPGSKPQLICFAEETKKDSTADTIKTTYSPANATHKVIAIDALPVPAGGSQKEASHDVVVVFDNGDVISLSSDLEIVRWVANVKSLAPSLKGNEVDIEYASFSTAKAVTHGFLRSRQDISAILNPSQDSQSDILDLTQVLCIVSRQSGKRVVGLLQVPPRSPDLPTSHLLPLKHLVSWDLPTVSEPLPQTSRLSYSIHANTGAVHILHEGGLLSYDFSGTIPKLASNIAISDATAFLRLGQDLLFTVSPKTCQILDSKYTSVQAEITLASHANSAVKESKKRKLAENESNEEHPSAPTLIAYYADLGLAVGTRDSEIIGFQLGGTTSRKRVKTEGTRLIDSIGKGIKTEAETVLAAHERQKWTDRMAKLDKYASKGKIARFEELLANDLGIELENTTQGEDKKTNGVDDSKMSNGVDHKDDDEPLPSKWKMPSSIPDNQRLRHKQYATYALSRIFRWIESPSSEGPRGCLKVDFFPPNVFEWLLRYGHLTKESIRRAILDDPTSTLGITTPIRDGEIIRAIVDFDPELHILSAILNHGHFLPVGEVVQALKLLMQTLDDQPKTEDTPKLLTNGNAADDSMDVDIASEMEAASHEIDRALAILDNGLMIRSSTLRPALIRLHTFPTSVISSTLRAMLPRHDLESLVRLLHHELRNGGWTTQYNFADSDDSNADSSTEEIDDSAVAIIASLLSCTLDAIGPATWLTGIGRSASDEASEDLIVDLLEDTSIALNGFWEATYIRSLVGEVLRYATKLPQSNKPSSKTLQDQGKPFALDLKPDEMSMLPVGSKPDLGIEKTKNRGGKRKERSAREMGMLISKRVPKYSFERIVI